MSPFTYTNEITLTVRPPLGGITELRRHTRADDILPFETAIGAVAEAGIHGPTFAEQGARQHDSHSASSISTAAPELGRTGWAALVSRLVSPDAAMRSAAAGALRERLVDAFESADVRSRLDAFGISVDEAQGRVPTISDLEVAELTLLLDERRSGAGDDLLAEMIEVLARTIASVLVLPVEVLFATFGIAFDDPFDAAEA